MKLLKKILLFVFIAMLIQGGILIYANFFFLKSDLKPIVSDNNQKLDTQILIQDNLDKISISSDGKFGAYIYNDKFYCLDLNSGIRKSIDLSTEAMNITFYKWMAGYDKIFVCEKDTSSKGNSLKIYLYDSNSFELKEFKDLTWTDISDIIDMDNYDSSNFLIKTKNKSGKIDLYNIASNVQKLETDGDNVGKIKAEKDGSYIYENQSKNRLVISDNKRNISLDGYKMVAFDNNNTLYAVNSTGDMVDKIYYYDSKGSWLTLPLKEKTLAENIFVMDEGKIYIDYYQSKKLVDLKANKAITYEGRLLGVYSEGAYFVKDGKLVKKAF